MNQPEAMTLDNDNMYLSSTHSASGSIGTLNACISYERRLMPY